MTPQLSGASEAIGKRFDSIAQIIMARPPETVSFNCVTALFAVLPTAVMTLGSHMQAFTLQKVPCPRWAKVIHDTIPPDIVQSAANLVINQLGDEGIARVGGKKWWQWRGTGNPPLEGEWIEMKVDFEERRRNDDTGNRVVMYLHGGAFYFGSVNSHRYQIQRHARLLKARAFA
ncbi:hypothetical protein KEM56_002388, partial [Ascosphaera pollenicola]